MEKCGMCIQTLCVSTGFGGTLARVEQHCSPELCVCVYLCVSRGWARTFWPGYVCRRAIRPSAQNQSVEPTSSGQICNLCVRACTHACGNRTERHKHPKGQTHNAYDANKQTWIQVFFPRASLYFRLTRTVTQTDTLSLSHIHTQTRPLPRGKKSLFLPVKKQVAYSSLSSFQWEMAMCMKEVWIKADLGEPDSGLICSHSAVFRGSNALTPIDCRRAEGEHFKC